MSSSLSLALVKAAIDPPPYVRDVSTLAKNLQRNPSQAEAAEKIRLFQHELGYRCAVLRPRVDAWKSIVGFEELTSQQLSCRASAAGSFQVY